MATGTSSPTPSEDNRQNNRDDSMYSALDKIMGNTVQTYDDFLNSFTFLKKGMQEKNNDGRKEKVNENTDKKKKSGQTKIKENQTDVGNVSEKRNKDMPVMSAESQGIEEEILCEGETTSRINKTKVIRTGSLVKFDNFVDPVVDEDEDGIEDIDDMSAECYSASFSTGMSTRNSGASEKGSEVTETVNAVRGGSGGLHGNNDITEMFKTQLSLDENSTDKLLLNFLADLQNEQNENNPENRSQLEAESSKMDIQNFLHKSKKPKKAKLTKPEEVNSECEEVNFNDDDDNDTIDLLCDDSETNDVKVKITEEDLKKMNESDEKAKARLDNVYRSCLLDSEGNVQIVSADEAQTEHGPVNDAIDFDKLVFPGQVEERNDEPVVENDTLLDFKATFRETLENSNQQMECTDLVQPFKLDEDFDYDNVVLTPKFSSEDLRQIKLTAQAQTVVM